MRKVFPLLFGFALFVWAADFWQAKPFAEWTDKDIQKMLNNSPWARTLGFSMNGPAPPTIGRTPPPGPDEGGPSPAISEQQGRGRGGGPAAVPGNIEGPSMTLTVRWQSALPMKEAVARLRWKGEASSSAEAKTFLDRVEPSYMIAVTGLPAKFADADQDKMKSELGGITTLIAKGKDKLSPSDVQFNATGRTMDAYFFFAKTMPFSLDDKEVEFSTKIAGFAVKTKFRFKDMVVNGKLEL